MCRGVTGWKCPGDDGVSQWGTGFCSWARLPTGRSCLWWEASVLMDLSLRPEGRDSNTVCPGWERSAATFVVRFRVLKANKAWRDGRLQPISGREAAARPCACLRRTGQWWRSRGRTRWRRRRRAPSLSLAAWIVVVWGLSRRKQSHLLRADAASQSRWASLSASYCDSIRALVPTPQGLYHVYNDKGVHRVSYNQQCYFSQSIHL